MSIEINEGIRAIFYIAWDGMDWMGSVYEGPDGPEAKYRFRHYRDESAFNSKDEKNWYTINPRKDADRASLSYTDLIETFDGLVAFSRKRFPGGKSWRLIRGEHSLEEFCDMFTQLPFVHARQVAIKDCKETLHRRDGRVTIALLHKPSGKTASADGAEHEIEKIRAKAAERLATQMRSPGETS